MPTPSPAAPDSSHAAPARRRAHAVLAAWLVFTAVAFWAAPHPPKLLLGACAAALTGTLLGQRAAILPIAYGAAIFLLEWLWGLCSAGEAAASACLCIAIGFGLGRVRDLRRELSAQRMRRRLAEEQVEIAMKHTEAVITVLPDAVYRIDRVGTILGPEEHAQTGQSPSMAQISDLLPKEFVKGALECINAALAGSDTISFPFQKETEGSSYEARMVRGGAHEVVALVRDVSREAELRRELLFAQQNALEAAGAKGRFLATMSHQIRTPMNGVVGMTNVLLQTKLTPEQREHTTIIRNSAEALLSILDDVLDYTRIEAGELELGKNPFPLRALIEEVAELLSAQAHANQVEVATMIDARIPDWVQGDRGRMRQVITNLVGNAVKFTSRGHIALRVTLVGHDRDTALIRFDVEDTGVGIAPEQQMLLFQDFSQANRAVAREFGGTGLGLSISRQIVEAMGGTLQVESSPGRGSVFSFTARLQMVHDRTTGSFLLPRALRGAHVCTFPMHPLTHEFLRQQLTPLGASIVVLGSPEELARRMHHGDSCEVAILDLPLGCQEADAEQRVQELLALCRGVPVVVLYGAAQRTLFDCAKRAGATALLSRPLKRAALYEAMVTALGLSERGPASRRRPRQAPPPPKLKARVLVVEDNLVNQKVAVRTLEMLGCEAQVADNGSIALDAVSQDDFDLVLMDCQMPIMDGYEATRLIRERERSLKRTPVIAMTANAMQGDRDRCIDAGMDDYLSKPVTLEMLDQVLRQWLPDNVNVVSRSQPLPADATSLERGS